MSYFNTQVQAVDSTLTRLRCYRDPSRIRNDCLDLLKNIPSLQARSGTLAKTTQSHIMYLAGTIPIFYQGVQYNIPVAIWLVEAYPFSPPVCYVTPTADMIIKPKHKHVDSAGMCYLPYLSQWNPNTSNLMGLTAAMAKVFGDDPPVRSQKPASTPPTQTSNPPYQNQSPYGQPPYSSGPYSSTGSGGPYPSSSSSPYPPSSSSSSPYPPQSQYPPQSHYGAPSSDYISPLPYQSGPQSLPQKPIPPPGSTSLPPSHTYENPAEVAKRNAIRAVTEKIQGKLHEFNVKTTRDIDEFIAKNVEIEDRSKIIDNEKEKIQNQLGQIDTEVDDLTKKFDDISKWLSGYDSHKVDIDLVTEPKEQLSKQLLDLVAEDATIEDTLYYLEKSLASYHGNDTNSNIDIFLKSVRSLSTDQFMKKATIKKIHEKQRGL